MRVKRDMRVEIPTLTGQTYDAAAADLAKLGLKATEQRGGSWIDRVLGADIRVCETTPPAGTLVQPEHDRHGRHRPGLLVGLGRRSS